MFLQETDLNVVPGGIIPVMHVSQYDVGRELKFVLYSGYDYASLESGTTVTIEGTKPDGHGFQYSGVLDQNAHTATFVTTEQMTVLAGAIECKLTLYLNSQRIGTALFILDVEKAGINDSTIISDTELPLIIAQATEQMERAEAAADAATLSEANAARSETNAANSEIICGSFMRMAGVSAASAEQSAIISGSFMRTAGNYADDAEASATSANVDALKSEGHALGTQNGTHVSSDSPYYHNNAKYWADEARQSSAGGVAARVIATAEPTNISSHAYAIGDQFVYNGILYTATSAISVGATITPGTNCSISDTITEQIGNAGKVTGVKGNSESTYRTGNVNISPADIGYFSGSTLSIGGSVPPSRNEGKFLKDDGAWENAGHTILDEDGVTYPQRSKLQFEGAVVSDDESNDTTIVETVNPVEYEEDIYGVNLLNVKPQTVGGVTFSVDANGYISADVEDLRGWRYTNCNTFISLKAGKYKVKAFQKTASSQWYTEFRIYKSDNTIVFQSTSWKSFIANGGEFTLSEDALIGVEYKVGNGSYAFAIYKDKLDIDDYRKFNEQSIQHQLTEQTNVLGAKNLIPYPYYSVDGTYKGVTFTTDSDGIITNSAGTTSDWLDYVLVNKRLCKQGSYRLVASGVADNLIPRVVDMDVTPNNDLIHWRNGVTEFMLTQDRNLKIMISAHASKAITAGTIKIMLVQASDPDNTYVPYAMTNRELTEVTTETLTISDSTVTGTFTVNKVGKVVMIKGWNVKGTTVKQGAIISANIPLPVSYVGTPLICANSQGAIGGFLYTNGARLDLHVYIANTAMYGTLTYICK